MLGRFLVLIAFLIFGLMATTSAQTSVPAQEILAKAAAHEPVYYDGVLITGNLDLSSLPGAQVQESLALVNCTIANASFSGVALDQDALFGAPLSAKSVWRRPPFPVRPTSAMPPSARNRYYVILEGITGWLLLALFLVTLGRVMIR